MPRSVQVQDTSIQQLNNYGPDGREAIRWRVTIKGVPVEGQWLDHQLEELLLALESWKKANAR